MINYFLDKKFLKKTIWRDRTNKCSFKNSINLIVSIHARTSVWGWRLLRKMDWIVRHSVGRMIKASRSWLSKKVLNRVMIYQVHLYSVLNSHYVIHQRNSKFLILKTFKNSWMVQFATILCQITLSKRINKM